MQVIASWTGGQADALRQAMRMTNESFAEYLGVAVRTVAYWRNRPGMTPQPQMQEVLDAALEQAHDRAKAKFSLLVSETADSPGDQPYTRSANLTRRFCAVPSRGRDPASPAAIPAVMLAGQPPIPRFGNPISIDTRDFGSVVTTCNSFCISRIRVGLPHRSLP